MTDKMTGDDGESTDGDEMKGRTVSMRDSDQMMTSDDDDDEDARRYASAR